MINRKFSSLPLVYPIVNLDTIGDSLGYVRKLLELNVTMLQLRAKNKQDHELIAAAQAIVNLRNEFVRMNGGTIQVIINDRPDIALLLHADGVHLGGSDLPPNEAREMLGPQAIIGLSTHNQADILDASDDVDYLGFGPIFSTTTKVPHEPVTGTALLSEALATAPVPVVAIGGITLENIIMVRRAGAQSVALSGALEHAQDLSTTMRQFQAALR